MKEIVFANYFLIGLGIGLAIFLAIIFSKVSFRYLMSLEGWTGFVAKLVLYIPCIISELVFGSIDVMPNIYAKIGLILVYIAAFLTIVYYIIDAFASTEMLRFGNKISEWINGNIIDQIIHAESTVETTIIDTTNTVVDGTVRVANQVSDGTVRVANQVADGTVRVANQVAEETVSAVKTGSEETVSAVKTGSEETVSAVKTGSEEIVGAVNSGVENIESFSARETINSITDMFKVPEWFKERAYMKSLYTANTYSLNTIKYYDITGLDELGLDVSRRAKNYTISAWVYLPNQSPVSMRILALRKASDANTGMGIPAVRYESDKLKITLSNVDANPPIKTVDILPQRWNHLVFVYSDNVAHFYLNSKLMFSEPLTNYLPTYSFSDELSSGDDTVSIMGKIGGVSYVPTTYNTQQIVGIYNATRGFYV